MPDRRRTAMALLMAASVFALPTSLLAGQDDKDSTSKTRNTTAREAQPERLRNARSERQNLLLAGPSRFALMSSRPISSGARARQYTEEELREIRAAQLRLVRDLSAGPSGNPSGGTVLSHPTLGRIVLSNTGASPTDPKTPGGRVSMPNPAMIFGPSAVAADPSTDPQSGGDPGDPGKPGGGGDDFPVLTPGSGFSGPTAQPPAVGNPHLRGYDAKAIARWDVVPYQDFDGLFHIGVVAFHMNGIDRVEFSVEGSPWEDCVVREMKLNPRTGVWEYTATLDASKFKDGQVEVRARVFPRNAGEVRVLGGEIDGHNAGSVHFRNGIHSMFLNANAGGTLPRHEVYADAVNGSDTEGDGSRANPFRSAGRALAHVTAEHGSSDGAVCYLMPGEYVWEGIRHPHQISTSHRWATVTSAPGVDLEDVKFVDNEPAGLRTRLVRADRVSLTGSGTPRTIDAIDSYFWLSNSAIAGTDRFDGSGIARGPWAGIYGTDVDVRDISAPFSSTTFVRNVSATSFSNTPFGADTMVLNAKVDDFSRHPGGTHADVFHWYWGDDQDRENRVIYGLEVHRFHLLGLLMNPISGGEQEIKDVAIVNVHISKDEVTPSSSMWGLDTNHLVISNFQLPDQVFRFDIHREDQDGQLTMNNVSISNSVFTSLRGNAVPEDASFRNIHLRYGHTYDTWIPDGVNITVGEMQGGSENRELFTYPSRGQYHPRPSGILWNRVPVADLLVPADVLGRPATGDMVPLGAYFGDDATGG